MSLRAADALPAAWQSAFGQKERLNTRLFRRPSFKLAVLFSLALCLQLACKLSAAAQVTPTPRPQDLLIGQWHCDSTDVEFTRRGEMRFAYTSVEGITGIPYQMVDDHTIRIAAQQPTAVDANGQLLPTSQPTMVDVTYVVTAETLTLNMGGNGDAVACIRFKPGETMQSPAAAATQAP